MILAPSIVQFNNQSTPAKEKISTSFGQSRYSWLFGPVMTPISAATFPLDCSIVYGVHDTPNGVSCVMIPMNIRRSEKWLDSRLHFYMLIFLKYIDRIRNIIFSPRYNNKTLVQVMVWLQCNQWWPVHNDESPGNNIFLQPSLTKAEYACSMMVYLCFTDILNTRLHLVLPYRKLQKTPSINMTQNTETIARSVQKINCLDIIVIGYEFQHRPKRVFMSLSSLHTAKILDTRVNLH